MRSLHALLLAALFAPGLLAQTTAKQVYEQLLAAPLDKSGDQDAQVKAAKAILEQQGPLLAEGDGLHYRARIQVLARTPWQDVLASYLAHAEARPDAALVNDSLVLAAQILHGRKKDWAGAQKLLAKVKSDQLADATRPTYDSLVLWTASDGAHAALIGKPAPDFEAVRVLQGPAKFTLQSLRGKVVLLEFWATW